MPGGHQHFHYGRFRALSERRWQPARIVAPAFLVCVPDPSWSRRSRPMPVGLRAYTVRLPGPRHPARSASGGYRLKGNVSRSGARTVGSEGIRRSTASTRRSRHIAAAPPARLRDLGQRRFPPLPGVVCGFVLPWLPPPCGERQLQSSCLGARLALLQKRIAAFSITWLSASSASLACRIASTPTTVSGPHCQRVPARTVRFPLSPSVSPA